MLNQNDPEYFDVGGTIIYEGTIGSYISIQQEVPTSYFARANKAILNLNESFVQEVEARADQCGYTEYMQKYQQFPPFGMQPPVAAAPGQDCDVLGLLVGGVVEMNPCATPYDVTARCPNLYDPLGQIVGNVPTSYFNRTDVRKAIHAPDELGHKVSIPQANQYWFECATLLNNPFIMPAEGAPAGPEDKGDISPDPIQGVLPQVIESTNRTLIVNGAYDYQILTNGTLLAIQNMTWNGALGFQTKPDEDFEVPGQGLLGTKHFERGLMWIDLSQTTHLAPQSQPRAALRHLMWVLGQIDDL